MNSGRKKSGEAKRIWAVAYNVKDYPLYINTENLRDFPEFQTTAHWNDNIEMILVLDGRMKVLINEKNLEVSRGDFLLIRPGQMHRFEMVDDLPCAYICVLFGEDVFTSCKTIMDNFINRIVLNKNTEYYHIRNNEDINAWVMRIHEAHERQGHGFQLKIIGYVHCLLADIYALFVEDLGREDDVEDELIVALRRMIRYIHQHYEEKITVEDIAASVNVSRTKCFRIFKKYIRQTPIDFVNEYRLTVSQHLLKTTNATIAEVAFSCGFAHQSYFTELFSRKFGCTPLQYRKGAVVPPRG